VKANGPPWMWRWGRKGRGRPPKPRFISQPPSPLTFIPFKNGERIDSEPVYILPDEYEALRLVYYEGLTQEKAAEQMKISRGTLWRALSNGRRKLVQALVEGKPIIVITPTQSYTATTSRE